MINLGLRNHCDYLWDYGTLLWTREIRVQNTKTNTNKYALFPRGIHIVNRKPFGQLWKQHHHPTGENQFHWPCSENPLWSLWLVHTGQNSETRQYYASITATGTLLTACHGPKATYHGVNSRSQFFEKKIGTLFLFQQREEMTQDHVLCSQRKACHIKKKNKKQLNQDS